MESADISTCADYRRLSRTFWGLLLLGLAAIVFVAALFLVERLGLHGLVWPLLGWTAVVACAGIRLQGFRCPRCKRRFFRCRPPLLALRGKRCAKLNSRALPRTRSGSLVVKRPISRRCVMPSRWGSPA